MLRSISYAAATIVQGAPNEKPDRKRQAERELIGGRWERDARAAFLRGYTGAMKDDRGLLPNDPKHFDARSFVDIRADVCIIPPNSFALAKTVEYFRIPRDVLTVCVGKSTYARCGLIVNVTPFEPEWEGFVTLEISNTTPLPARVYANEGIAQVLFFQSDEPCEVSYADKKGKYQKQQGLTLPRL
jgi:deoxycytidine triphosphate deaminase